MALYQHFTFRVESSFVVDPFWHDDSRDRDAMIFSLFPLLPKYLLGNGNWKTFLPITLYVKWGKHRSICKLADETFDRKYDVTAVDDPYAVGVNRDGLLLLLCKPNTKYDLIIPERSNKLYSSETEENSDE